MALSKYYLLGLVILSFVCLYIFRIFNSQREKRRQEQRDRLKETRERYIRALINDSSTKGDESGK